MNKPWTLLRMLMAFIIGLAGLMSADIHGAEDRAMHSARLDNAMRLMDENSHRKAYDLLWELIMENPTDTTLNTCFARTAFKLKRYENAAAYERILMASPDQHRIRFQLAVAYYHLKADVLAEEQFLKLLKTDPPPEFKKAIEAYLKRIRENRQKHRFYFDSQVGLTYDGNANIGPDTDLIQTARGSVATPDDTA